LKQKNRKGKIKENVKFYFKNLILPVITREGGFKTTGFGKKEAWKSLLF
jgi:hypothetical protein